MSSVSTARDPAGDDDLPIVNAPFRFWGGVVDDVRAMVAQRELMRSFVARELRQRYKGSFLGWGWALVRPLVMLAVYGVAVGVFLGANKSVPQFAVYLYTGLVAWGFFSAIITGSIATLPGNAGLINKANFQRELLVVAVAVVAVIDLLIQTSVLLIGFAAYGAWPALSALWWLVPGFLVILLVGLGLGLVLSAANVYFRDVGYFAEVALQIGFWVVPILYAYSMVQTALADYPALLDLYTANPLTSAITAFRYGLWPAAATPAGAAQLMPSDQVLTLLAISTLGSLVLIWLAQRYFARVSGNLAQELYVADTIRFEGVSKVFTIKDSKSLKDFVLGIAGHRPSVSTVTAVNDLSFTVAEGQSVALLGHNGSGKSTSLKMLSGVIRPSSGTIRARGRIAPLLELGSGFHPDLTGRENIFLNGAVLGIRRQELQRRFDEIVDFSGVEEFLDTPVKFYSSGMVVRLGFAVAVNVEPEILLVDEVLSVGDTEFQKTSLDRMNQFRRDGVTIIFVTHDENAAADFCDRVLRLDHGRLVYDGPFAPASG